jgi:hypothetical protein
MNLSKRLHYRMGMFSGLHYKMETAQRVSRAGCGLLKRSSVQEGNLPEGLQYTEVFNIG